MQVHPAGPSRFIRSALSEYTARYPWRLLGTETVTLCGTDGAVDGFPPAVPNVVGQVTTGTESVTSVVVELAGGLDVVEVALGGGLVDNVVVVGVCFFWCDGDLVGARSADDGRSFVV